MPPITEPFEIAIVGLCIAVLGTFSATVVPLITSRTRTKEAQMAAEIAKAQKQLDWERQDRVAAKAAEAAALLVQSNERIADQNKTTQGQLKEIHTLVNSNLTKEMHDRLAAVKGQVALTEEIIRLNRLNNLEPTPETILSLKNLGGVVTELTLALRERNVATNKAADEKKF